jgi:hypothetical protein
MTIFKGYPVRTAEGEQVGYLHLDDDFEGAVLDLALTPVVQVDGETPEIEHFLISQRTMLDTRPREEMPPFAHVGPEPSP